MLVSVEPALRALTKEMLGLEGGFLGSYVRPKFCNEGI